MMFKHLFAPAVLLAAIVSAPLADAAAQAPTISIVEGTWYPSTTQLVLSAVFASSVSPANSGSPDALLGQFVIDYDQLASTGSDFAALFPGTWAAGSEYYVDLSGATDDGAGGFEVPIYSDLLSAVFGVSTAYVPILFSGGNSIAVTLNFGMGLGVSAPLAGGSADFGLVVRDPADLNIVNTAPTPGPDLAAANVPEPGTILMLGLGAFALALRQPRSPSSAA